MNFKLKNTHTNTNNWQRRKAKIKKNDLLHIDTNTQDTIERTSTETSKWMNGDNINDDDDDDDNA